MPRCIMSKSNGIPNRILFVRTFIEIVKATPVLFLLVLISEFLIGIIQTVVLIAWENAINKTEHFLISRDDIGIVVIALIASLATYVLTDILRMLVESLHTLQNNQLSEYFQEKLNNKCRLVNALQFEDPELYNEIDRAKNAIDYMVSLMGIFGIFVMSASRLSTLGTYVFFVNPVFTLIVLLPVVPILITRIIRGRDLYQLNYKQSEKRRECEYYRSCIKYKETRTLNATSYFKNKWEELYCQINEEERIMNMRQSWIFLALNLLKYGIYILAILVAAKYLFNGFIGVGTFTLITAMIGTTHATIEVTVEKSGDISGSLRYARDYFTFLDKSVEVLKGKAVLKQSVKLEQVCFQYPGASKPVLNHVDLTLYKGEKIALVGVNGAGKTTLAKMIAGLFEPSSGKVIYNGISRLPGTLADCSLVFQDFCKYYLTLRENVAFGNIEMLHEDQILKSKLEDVFFDLKKTEDSLDTQLGREFEGVGLSGGEWQKIAIARGFIKECDFIILDEPNSGLDPLAESKLFHSFLEFLEDKTGIIITHRLGTAALADRILLMDEGKIIEDGTHEELMQIQGQYQKMFSSQAEMYQ